MEIIKNFLSVIIFCEYILPWIMSGICLIVAIIVYLVARK